MPKQTSIQLTEATQRQVSELQAAGYGSFTDITRIAIDRMYQKEIEMDEIKIITSTDGLWGSDDPHMMHIDVDASTDKFVEELRTAVSDAYPNSNITIVLSDSDDKIFFNGETAANGNYDAEMVADILGRVFAEFNWIVLA